MIIPTNEIGQPHGHCELYWHNGNLESKGNCINGRRNGLWEYYSPDGILIEQRFYT